MEALEAKALKNKTLNYCFRVSPIEKKQFLDTCEKTGATPASVIRGYMRQYVEQHSIQITIKTNPATVGAEAGLSLENSIIYPESLGHEKGKKSIAVNKAANP